MKLVTMPATLDGFGDNIHGLALSIMVGLAALPLIKKKSERNAMRAKLRGWVKLLREQARLLDDELKPRV